MELQSSRKEIQRQQQRDWYHKNKDKVKIMKQSWYEKNRERALAKNKEWRDKQKEQKEIEESNEKLKSFKTPTDLNFFQILDILRKDNRHYLWGLSIQNWTERDWYNFIQLKDGK